MNTSLNRSSGYIVTCVIGHNSWSVTVNALPNSCHAVGVTNRRHPESIGFDVLADFQLADDLKTAGKSPILSVRTQRMRSCAAPRLLKIGDRLTSRTVNVLVPIFDLNLG